MTPSYDLVGSKYYAPLLKDASRKRAYNRVARRWHGLLATLETETDAVDERTTIRARLQTRDHVLDAVTAAASSLLISGSLVRVQHPES